MAEGTSKEDLGESLDDTASTVRNVAEEAFDAYQNHQKKKKGSESKGGSDHDSPDSGEGEVDGPSSSTEDAEAADAASGAKPSGEPVSSGAPQDGPAPDGRQPGEGQPKQGGGNTQGQGGGQPQNGQPQGGNGQGAPPPSAAGKGADAGASGAPGSASAGAQATKSGVDGSVNAASQASSAASNGASAGASAGSAGASAGTAAAEGGASMAGEAAAGGAAGPVGLVVSTVFALRKPLFKLLCVIFASFLIIIMFILQGLPTVVTTNLFGLNGQTPPQYNEEQYAQMGEDGELSQEYQKLMEKVTARLEKNKEKSYDEIAKILQSEPYNLPVSATDIRNYINGVYDDGDYNDEYMKLPGENGERNIWIEIGDASKYSNINYEAAFIMACYSVSQQNKPYTMEDGETEDDYNEDDPTIWQRIFGGSNKDKEGTFQKDLLRRLKTAEKSLYQISSPPDPSQIPEQEYPVVVKKLVEFTKEEYDADPYYYYEPIQDSAEPLQHLLYQVMGGGSREFGQFAANESAIDRSIYYDYTLFLATKRKVEYNTTVTGIQLYQADSTNRDYYFYNPTTGQYDGNMMQNGMPLNGNNYYLCVSGAESSITGMKSEMREVTEMHRAKVYNVSIGNLDTDKIYEAFGISKYGEYGDTGHKNYEVVENMCDLLFEAMGDTSGYSFYSDKNYSTVSSHLISANGVEWYVLEPNVKMLKKLENHQGAYVDHFYPGRNGAVSPQFLKQNFMLDNPEYQYTYKDSIVSAEFQDQGKLVVRYTKTNDDGTTTTEYHYWLSSEYYDPQSDTFISPLSKYGNAVEIRSHFGYRDPVNGRTSTYHGAVDLGHRGGETFGWDVCATASGTVVYSGFNGYGNCVAIYHGNGFYSLYGHLAKETGGGRLSPSNSASDAPLVQVGDTVIQGQVIGHVGTTFGSGGYSSGPHLHFEIRIGSQSAGIWGAKKADPEQYMRF